MQVEHSENYKNKRFVTSASNILILFCDINILIEKNRNITSIYIKDTNEYMYLHIDGYFPLSDDRDS